MERDGSKREVMVQRERERERDVSKRETWVPIDGSKREREWFRRDGKKKERERER